MEVATLTFWVQTSGKKRSIICYGETKEEAVEGCWKRFSSMGGASDDVLGITYS